MKKFFFSAQGLSAAALICALVSPLIWFALLPRLIGSADGCSGSRFCAGHSRHLKAPLGGQEDADIRGRRPLSLMDFPAAADAPGSPFSTRPRRLVRMAALWTPSAAILAQLSGGKGFRPQSPAAATYGLRLHLAFPQDERELKELFLAGGDDSGADVMAISLERFVALLPELLPARPEIFLLSAYSRGASELVASAKSAADIPSLRGKPVAFSSENAGRYFLLWRLLRDGVDASEIQWLPAASAAEAFTALKSGRAAAAFAGALDIGAVGETLLLEGESAPGAVDEVNAEGEADECKPEDPASSGQAGGGGDTAQPAADSAPAAENAENEDHASPPAASDSLHTLATTADAPLLSPIVLVVRGDFAARYPETVRRLARAVLAEGALAADTPLPAARRLLERFPWVTDPRKMLALEPSASLADNKAFFGLSKSPAHPVPYGELFSSMLRVLEASGAGGAAALDISPEDVFWDGPIKSLSEKALVTAKTASRTAQSADAKAAQTEPAEAAETAEAQGNSASEAGPAAASGPDESN